MRKVLFVLLVLLIALPMVFAGGGSQPSGAAPKASGGDGKISGSIEVGVLPAEGTTAFTFLQDMADRLMAKYPGASIKYTFANTKARPFMEQRWRADDAPDIDYFVFNAQVPSTHEFIPKLLDLTPYLAQGGWGDTFLDSAYAVTRLDGHVYGVVTDAHLILLFYNKKMFDQLGLTPPQTWDQLIDVGHALQKNGIDPIAVTGMFNPYMGYWMDYAFMREVGYQASRDAIVNGTLAGNPGFLRAAQRVEQLAKDNFFLKGFQGTDFTAAQMQFFQGKTGMILMGTWLSSEMKDSIPSDFQLGVTAFPTISGGSGSQDAVMSHNNIMSVNKNTKNLDLVLTFLKEITSVDLQTARCAQLQQISAVKGVPAPQGIFGLDNAVQNSGDRNVRNFGLEYEPTRNEAYYNAVARLFFGQTTAEGFIKEADDAMSRIH